MLLIDEIRQKIYEHGTLINAPLNLLNVPDKATSDGTPYIEVVGDVYNYVISERGLERYRDETKEINDLLHWFFSDITSTMSFDYELKHRIPNQDCRRLIFKHKLELLKQLDHDWYEKEIQKIKSILEKSPYQD